MIGLIARPPPTSTTEAIAAAVAAARAADVAVVVVGLTAEQETESRGQNHPGIARCAGRAGEPSRRSRAGPWWW